MTLSERVWQNGHCRVTATVERTGYCWACHQYRAVARILSVVGPYVDKFKLCRECVAEVATLLKEAEVEG